MHPVKRMRDRPWPFQRLYQFSNCDVLDRPVTSIGHQDGRSLRHAVFAALEVGHIPRLGDDADENLRARREGPIALDAGDEVGAHLRVDIAHLGHDRLLELRAALAEDDRSQVGVVVLAHRIGHDEAGFARARGPPEHEHLGGGMACCVLGIRDWVPVPTADF